MTPTVSFPRERIRFLLLEGVHESAVETLYRFGYTNVERLKHALTGDDLRAALEGVHFVGIRSRTQFDENALAAASKLVALGCFCIGTNQVALEAAAHRGVPVFNAPHSNTRSVAELVTGLCIMLMRGTFAKSSEVHAGRWPKTASGSREVRGKTLGIVGYGHIGSQVSVLAESLGMRIIYHDIVDTLPLGNAQRRATLHEVLKEADIVTLHVPETPLTKGLIGKAELAAMKPGSQLVQTSRGVVVDIPALAAALSSGHLAGAAVDVFPVEPKSTDAPLDTALRGMPNVILTPHVAGSTEEAQEKIGVEVANKFVGYSEHGTSVGAVNFPELSLAEHEDAHRILHIHRNIPGVLRAVNDAIADEGINLLSQHLQTKGEIGYVVLDIARDAEHALRDRLEHVEGTIRTRILY
ncbi:MAG: phosphoglycerate dehydrogenase [Planctomycetota bacterium]|jgi:D-3-phosphoglycerate dehydrogenase